MSRFLLALLLILNVPATTFAFSVKEAQICADKLLSAYNGKTYPRKLLAIENIVSTAFGPPYRSFSEAEIALAQSVGEQHIRESFTESTGKYKYKDLVVSQVEATKNGYRALGEVTVISPKGNGRYSFLALVIGENCKVYQVRIADVMTLVGSLQALLENDPRVRSIYKK